VLLHEVFQHLWSDGFGNRYVLLLIRVDEGTQGVEKPIQRMLFVVADLFEQRAQTPYGGSIVALTADRQQRSKKGCRHFLSPDDSESAQEPEEFFTGKAGGFQIVPDD
jgi:hypothetical protein